MYHLDLSVVPRWNSESNLYYPGAVNINCPHCGNLVSFTPAAPTYDTLRKTWAMSSECPACQAGVFFWAIRPGKVNQPNSQKCESLGVFPAPQVKREPITDLDLVPDGIRRAYQGAVTVFNAGVWSSTAESSRRTLEGVVHDLMPGSKGSLYQRLQKLIAQPDLLRPLQELTNSIREGGNIGAHFDPLREPDRETALAILELIEYFLEYVYILPARADRLNQRIAALDTNKDTLDTPAPALTDPAANVGGFS